MISAVVMLAALSAAIYIGVQQHALRARAEHLLADVRGFQLHGGTVADAQRIADNWERFANVERKCDAQTCQIDIGVHDQIWVPQNAFRRIAVWSYWAVGWHETTARATIEARNGTVDRTEFILMLDVPPYVSQVDRGGYGLFGRAVQQEEFGPYQFWPQRKLHPTYFIGKPGGCEGCIKLMTFSLPTTPPAKIEELTNFDLSCITRWFPCTTEADILPSAWKQYQAESGRGVE
ncbi:hypothetical protein [Occallatibacter savannae]|uniref:hypothetical protein n=1 Tax=Occallatibacter savannae TaxID=1002691 RepID=UPI0013A5426E|nr:hypothetical protein [Occallatibacter savannae]